MAKQINTTEAAQDKRLPYEWKQGRPNFDQLEAWKKEHGKLHIIEDDGCVAVMREPKLHNIEMALAASKLPKALPLAFNRNIAADAPTGCMLYIDPDFRNDDKREQALLTAIGQVVEIREAKVTAF